jgi:hypothetical protein
VINRAKGDRYRPVVDVAKQKNGVPTVIIVSGKRYTLSGDHMRANQEKGRKPR